MNAPAKPANLNPALLSRAAKSLEKMIESLEEAGLIDELKLSASPRLIDVLGGYGDVSHLILTPEQDGDTADALKVNCFGVSAEDFVRESQRLDVVFSVAMGEEACGLMDLKGDANLAPNLMTSHFTDVVAARYAGVPRVVASWQPQAWQNNCAIDIDGKCEIDITDAVLALPHDADFLTFANANDMWLEEELDQHPFQDEHAGPYHCDAEDSLRQFIRNVSGRELGEPFSAEEWEKFKQSYREILAIAAEQAADVRVAAPRPR